MSPALEGLPDLLERIEAATGSDRELDGRIWCAINGYNFVAWDGAGVVYRFREPGIRHMDAAHVQPVTRSVDSALALVERVLPGWTFTIARHYGHDNPTGPFYADMASVEWIQDLPGTEGQQAEAYGATPALALLSALLKALIAKASPQ